MPINSNQRQNANFSQAKKPKTKNTGNSPTKRRLGKSRK